jgi:hypothetical protein
MGVAEAVIVSSLFSAATRSHEGRKQAKAERKVRKKAEARQNELAEQAEARVAEEEAGLERNRRRDMQRKRLRQQQSRMRGGTIRTSPLGLPAEGETILGG